MVNTNYISRHTGQEIDDAVDKIKLVKGLYIHNITVQASKYDIGTETLTQSVTLTYCVVSNSNVACDIATLKDFLNSEESNIINVDIYRYTSATKFEPFIIYFYGIGSALLTATGWSMTELSVGNSTQLRVNYNDIESVTDNIHSYVM